MRPPQTSLWYFRTRRASPVIFAKVPSDNGNLTGLAKFISRSQYEVEVISSFADLFSFSHPRTGVQHVVYTGAFAFFCAPALDGPVMLLSQTQFLHSHLAPEDCKTAKTVETKDSKKRVCKISLDLFFSSVVQCC